MSTWITAEQIAARWVDVTPQRVVQMISLLGIAESQKHRKGPGWSSAAVGLIERELKSRGYQREGTDSARAACAETVGRAWMAHPEWEWCSGMIAVSEDGERERVIAVEGEWLLVCQPFEDASARWLPGREYVPDGLDAGTAAIATRKLSEETGP